MGRNDRKLDEEIETIDVDTLQMEAVSVGMTVSSMRRLKRQRNSSRNSYDLCSRNDRKLDEEIETHRIMYHAMDNSRSE